MSILDINSPVKKTKKDRFIDDNIELSEKQISIEILYWQKQNNFKLEKIRSNLSTIVWIIILLIVISIVAALMV